ncbi:MAG: hypothetical protein JXX14_13145 [Deltaproteobacteria bacterium]|nr:hypothetical protein [Deltaproteobacteria bacterium]
MSISVKLIIMALALICVGCGKPSESDQSKPADVPRQTTGNGTSTEAPIQPVFDYSKVLLKGPGTVLQKSYGEWGMASEPRYFGPDNLYDLINGGSEIFIDYGFLQIVTTDYRSSAHPDKTITAEVYDMSTPLGAFGRVSKYLENLASPKDAGKGLPAAMAPYGILGDGDLIFWRGKYLVHLMLMDEDPAATPDSIAAFSNKVIPVIGQEIFNGIEAADAPALISVFPLDHLVERSQAYYYDFEIVDLKIKAYTARYQKSDISWMLFCAQTADLSADQSKQLQAAINGADDGWRVLRIGDYFAGVQLDSNAKPDAELLKKQLDALQAALKSLK